MIPGGYGGNTYSIDDMETKNLLQYSNNALNVNLLGKGFTPISNGILIFITKIN